MVMSMEACTERYTIERIRSLAQTACLGLSDEEALRLSGELGRMLALVEVLNDVPREESAVCPTVEVALEELRPDVAETSLSSEEVLSLSPIPAQTYFCVPRVVEERS